MTTLDTVTDTQIERLRAEAASAGDVVMVDICQHALAGSETARRECARVIANAKAQESPMDYPIRHLDTVTDTQIESLRREATAAGDLAMVHICRQALDGIAWARRECARVIADAEAQE